MYERVLVIDDSQDIRDFLVENILRPKGFEVLTASDGLMGLELAIAKEPDLMITDQQMPGLTGLQVLQKLRERNIDIPAILITGEGSEDTAVRAFRLGIKDYIIKPIDADELSESVDKALRENRLQKERDQLVEQLMESNAQLQRRAQELNVLYGVGKSVSSSLDLEAVSYTHLDVYKRQALTRRPPTPESAPSWPRCRRGSGANRGRGFSAAGRGSPRRCRCRSGSGRPAARWPRRNSGRRGSGARAEGLARGWPSGQCARSTRAAAPHRRRTARPVTARAVRPTPRPARRSCPSRCSSSDCAPIPSGWHRG